MLNERQGHMLELTGSGQCVSLPPVTLSTSPLMLAQPATAAARSLFVGYWSDFTMHSRCQFVKTRTNHASSESVCLSFSNVPSPADL